ncbi:MAG: hypothetical protein SFU83_20865 [Meiothermus sp.]|nr:hypothetical protein [Meiothermus sp.]
MKLLRSLALIAVALAGTALADTLDVFEYTPPPGWKKTPLEGGVMHALQTPEAFGLIALYTSVVAGSDAKQNFQGEWKRLVNEGLGLRGEATVEAGPVNGGYQNLVGGMAATQDGTQIVVLLSTFTGLGRVASVLYLTTSQDHLELFDQFNASLKLNRPITNQAPPPAPPQAARPNQGSSQGAGRSISTPTTNFDDGWTASVQRDFVRVAKGETLVLLHYAQPLPENMWVSGNEKERVMYYWNRLVAGRYRADGPVKVFDNGICYTCLYFGESSATESATGQAKHVALYIHFNKGQGYAIQVVAPNFAAFQRDFPNIEAVGRMAGYNKFQVKPADLTGTWTESSSSALMYYNTLTGASAGMNAVSGNNEFAFNADGSYTSKHVGAFGFVGSQTFYNDTYRGRVNLSGWRMSLTNRFKNKTEVYEAYFEITGGGPVLRLTQVDTSLNYALTRK